MKRSSIVVLVIISLGLMSSVLVCSEVWAGGTYQPGGTSEGGGTTCDCHDPICSESCNCNGSFASNNEGECGGGANWRIYKLNANTDTTDLDDLNSNAKWEATEALSLYGGKRITGKKGMLSTCAKSGAPYIVVFGLNGIVLNKNSKKPFYVSFNREPGNNRGSYYEENKYNIIEDAEDLDSFKSGQAISGSLAKKLFRKEFGTTQDFISVGSFCTWLGEKTLTAYARDESGGKLLNKKKAISTDTVEEGETATVHAIELENYTFTGKWSKTQTGAVVKEGTDSYEWSNMKDNHDVYAIYKPKEECVGECCDEDCDGECGSWTPSSYTSSYSDANGGEGTTSTATRIRNLSLGEGWKESETFAKPTDQIGWIHCYYPGVQKVADNLVTPDTHKSGEGNSCDRFSTSCSSPPSYSLNNIPFKSYISWSNSYKVSRDFSNTRTLENWSGAAGDASTREYNDNTYIVEPLAVSNTMTETIGTGSPIWAKVWMVHGPNSWGCVWAKYGQEKTGERFVNCKTDADGNVTCDKEDIMTDVYAWSSTCSHSETYYEKSYNSGTTDSRAWVKVPYNYELSSELDEGDMKKDYYAGEEVEGIKSWSFVNPRQNNVTSGSYGEYATIVRSAKKRLEVCVKNDSGYCYYTNPDSVRNGGVLNKNGLMDGVTERINGGNDDNSETVSFNVPDVAAGTEICIRSGLFPKDSGEDKNMNAVWGGYDVNNIEHWAWSEPMCVRVSKRPSIQVLGGNVYSGGNIVASLGTKKLIAGRYDENDPAMIDIIRTSVGTGARTFGSWGELGVISKSGVKGFASGAAVGYAQIQNPKTIMTPDPFVDPSIGNVLGSNPGGSTEKDFCEKLSPLTIAGACSGNEFKNGYGNKGNSNNRLTVDYKSILTMVNEKNGAGGTNDTGIEIVEGQIAGGTYQRNRFGVLSHDGDIKITGDIMIDEGVYFETFSQIPKLVIYTKGNIEIGCDVGRIDAILVAGGTVSTCVVDDFGGLDESNGGEDDDNRYDGKQNHVEYSRRQLQINGAIIAAKLDASRTFGAATGSDSIVPAEMINYDPTLYLWNTAAADTSDGDKNTGLNGELTVTYINELAPRY